MNSRTDQNLLIGILALQLDFITNDQLIAAMHAWLLDKSTALDVILRRQGVIRDDAHGLLIALVNKHLEMHGLDAQRSLAAIKSDGQLHSDLRALADPDIQASLRVIPNTASQAETTHIQLQRPAQDGNRFRVLRPHARGGLGEVFIAEDLELRREVALKEIMADRADDPVSRNRFLLEAEITGGLEHPGIVPIYGLGQYGDGRPFYAMRFIRGDSLKEAVDSFFKSSERPRLDSAAFRRLLGRFLDVCNAIEYAHSRGVLHRDLKPGNVMLGKYGETLVVDWGLAKAQGRSESSKDLDAETSLRPSSGGGSSATRMGEVIGTPAFMSPEQAAGRLDKLGATSDVYSLGATLYYLLTGSPPFDREPIADLLRKVERGEFSAPRTYRAEIPKALEAICLRAMAREPEDRYSSPHALAEDLERYLADEELVALPDSFGERISRLSRRHRSLVRAGSAALLAIAIVSVVAAVVVNEHRRRNATLADENGGLARDKGALAQKNAELFEAERIAKDAATAAAEESKELAARLSVEKGAELLEKGDLDIAAHWFARACELQPNPQKSYGRVARRALGTCLQKMHTLQCIVEFATPLLAVQHAGRPGWILAGSKQGAIQRVALSDGAVEPQCQFSCDELIALTIPTSLLYAASIDKQGHVELWDLQAGKLLHRLPDGVAAATKISVTQDGRLLAVAYPREVRIFDCSEEPAQFKTIPANGGVLSVAFSSDNEFIAIGGGEGRLSIWEIQQPRLLTTLNAGHTILDAVFNTSGDQVAVSRWFGPHLLDVSGARPNGAAVLLHGLTFIGSSLYSPSSSLISACGKDGSASVWDVDHRERLAQPLRHFSKDLQGQLFSNDGRTLVTFGGLEQGRGELRVWKIATRSCGDVVLKHDDAVTAVGFSSDGALMAFADDQYRFFVADRESGRILSGPLAHPALNYTGAEPKCNLIFSKDKRVLVTTSMSGGICRWDWMKSELIGEPIDNGKTEPVPNLNSVLGALLTTDDKCLVVTGGRGGLGYVRSFDFHSGERLQELDFPGYRSLSVAASSSQQQALVGGDMRHTRIWDPQSGSVSPDMIEHPSSVYSLAFASDGRLLLAGYYDGSIQAWDFATGKPIGVPARQEPFVRRLSTGNSGDTFISVDRSRCRTFDVATLKLIEPPIPVVPFPSPCAVALEPKNRETVIGDPEGTIRSLQSADPWNEPANDLQAMICRLTGVELSDDGAVLPLSGSAWKNMGAAWGGDAGKIVELQTPKRITAQGRFYHQLQQNDLAAAAFTAEAWANISDSDAHAAFRSSCMLSECAFAIESQHVDSADEDDSLLRKCQMKANTQLRRAMELGYPARTATRYLKSFDGIRSTPEFRTAFSRPGIEKNLAYRLPGSMYPRATASHTSVFDDVNRANDGDDDPSSRWTSFQSPSTTDWLQVEFADDQEVSVVEILIYDEPPVSGGGVRTPSSWRVEYLSGSEWKGVEEVTRKPETPAGGRWNSVSFEPVTTKKVRVVFEHQEGFKSGVTEIVVWDTESARL